MPDVDDDDGDAINDLFFDSLESFVSDEVDYGVWLSGLSQSVRQRRENFLRNLGFRRDPDIFREDDEIETTDVVTETSEASTTTSSSNAEFCNRRRTDGHNSELEELMNINCNENAVVANERAMDKARSWLNRLWRKTGSRKKTELNSFHVKQEINAGHGYIWTMKFSAGGKYLGTAGEDGVVRVWLVVSRSFFQDTPLHEFREHTDDILDLDWFGDDLLLSSSKDKSVRLRRVGSDERFPVFRHKNYVTCIRFNPVDDNQFISGSVDGKVRIWGIARGRVIRWTEIGTPVTAVAYDPDGEGFVIGSISGDCRMYRIAGGDDLVMTAKIQIGGRRKKKKQHNQITSIQFCPGEPLKILVSSEDSKLRLLDAGDVVQKFKGTCRNGGLRSASFTPTGDHVISVGEDDSCVHVWSHDDTFLSAAGTQKSVRPSEHFSFYGVSVAVPWPASSTAAGARLFPADRREASSWIREADWPSFSSWFGIDVPNSRSATWPEEKLRSPEQHERRSRRRRYEKKKCSGLIIVAGFRCGTIRTFSTHTC